VDEVGRARPWTRKGPAQSPVSVPKPWAPCSSPPPLYPGTHAHPGSNYAPVVLKNPLIPRLGGDARRGGGA
jgi:hypothetical protein